MKLVGIILAIISILLLTLGHEFGHFITAKSLNMRVSEFSVGVGPVLWKKKKGDTQYSFRAIPVAGYCAFDNETDIDENGEVEIVNDERSFNNQPAWAKIIVLLAGSFMNIVIGILIFTLVFSYVGVAVPVLSKVVPEGPAYEAGLLPGDKITGVNGTHYKDFQSIQTAILTSTEDEIEILYKRGGKEETAICSTYINEYGNRAVGIEASVSKGFSDCLKQGIRETGVIALSIRDFLGSVFKGNVKSDDVTGIVGVISMAGESAEYGLINVFYLIALISANLGYMNLLPFPALDGGRILMTLIRGIFKGKISDEAEGIVHTIGAVILIILMIFILFNDTLRIFK